MLVYKTESPEETFLLGRCLASLLSPGDVICLSGDLGAGKTLLTKGLVKGLDYEEEVTSPTFSIMNIYEARVPIYHFDLYRLDYPEELEDIGFEEYAGKNSQGVAIIEWPDKFTEYLPDEYMLIEIGQGEHAEQRVLKVKPNSTHYQKICEELKAIAHTCFRYSHPSI